tara:strand:+ start:1436 stop:1618 length:183 start_codon:yes stop_codon:yes gene_type:complete
LRNFGAFSVQERRERIGRNPRTGESVRVDAKRIPRFKPGKNMKLKINQRNAENNNQSEPE